MKIHELKLDTEYFDDVKSGLKTFEIRKNDRDFKDGDVLALTAFEYGHYVKKAIVGFSGNAVYDRATQQEAETIFFDVTFITDYEQKDGYVVMSIVPSRKVSLND
ncbi:MAG: DUF3850 domain-containing protein [Lentilactobacillus hilgardii]|uniref:DUF3850 domain-containing protein n=1 Tax=Lentilactobacillus hilgardii TaxID=1588 RepID=UPI0039EA0402